MKPTVGNQKGNPAAQYPEFVADAESVHNNIAKLACAVVDDAFGDETVGAMNAELQHAVETRGYGQL